MASPEEEKWPSLSTGAIGNGMPSCGASSAGGEHLQSVIGVQQSSRGRDRSLTEKPEGFHDVWILYVFFSNVEFTRNGPNRWTDFEQDFPERSTADLVNNCMKTINPMAGIAGFDVKEIKWCSMHCSNIGILLILNGSLASLLLERNFSPPSQWGC